MLCMPDCTEQLKWIACCSDLLHTLINKRLFKAELSQYCCRTQMYRVYEVCCGRFDPHFVYCFSPSPWAPCYCVTQTWTSPGRPSHLVLGVYLLSYCNISLISIQTHLQWVLWTAARKISHQVWKTLTLFFQSQINSSRVSHLLA